MSPHPSLLVISASIFLLLLPLAHSADMPFVFGEDTPSLEGLGPEELQELAASAPGLEGVPKVSTVPEDEVMVWTEVGGKTVATGGTKSTAGELKETFDSRGRPGGEDSSRYGPAIGSRLSR